jgi:hypothetical protein
MHRNIFNQEKPINLNFQMVELIIIQYSFNFKVYVRKGGLTLDPNPCIN